MEAQAGRGRHNHPHLGPGFLWHDAISHSMEGLSNKVKSVKSQDTRELCARPRERESQRKEKKESRHCHFHRRRRYVGFPSFWFFTVERSERAELGPRRRLPVARGGLSDDPSWREREREEERGRERERGGGGRGGTASDSCRRRCGAAAATLPFPPRASLPLPPPPPRRSRRLSRATLDDTDVVMAGVRKEELRGGKVLPTAAAEAAAAAAAERGGEQRDSTVALWASPMLDAARSRCTKCSDGFLREDSHAICADIPLCTAKVGKSKIKKDRLVTSCLFDVQREMREMFISVSV